MPESSFYGFVNSPLGLAHLAASLLALMLGAFVLATRKGTRRHKLVGYAYVTTMIVVCATALGIYDLTGRFGPFHAAAIVGFLTIAGGMIPMFMKGIQREWREFHVWFMYYSVVGLYAAFFSELLVRVPSTPFFGMVGIATGATMAIGTGVILWKIRDWSKPFRSRSEGA